MSTGIIKVLYINNDGGGYADTIEIAENTTVRQFVADRVSGNATDYLIRVNREPTSADYILKDGDRITITPTKVEGA